MLVTESISRNLWSRIFFVRSPLAPTSCGGKRHPSWSESGNEPLSSVPLFCFLVCNVCLSEGNRLTGCGSRECRRSLISRSPLSIWSRVMPISKPGCRRLREDSPSLLPQSLPPKGVTNHHSTCFFLMVITCFGVLEFDGPAMIISSVFYLGCIFLCLSVSVLLLVLRRSPPLLESLQFFVMWKLEKNKPS